jgi:hypothetical protein
MKNKSNLIFIEHDLYNIQNVGFNIFIIVSYFLLITANLGLWMSAPKYLILLNNIVSIYICLFLLYRFNPFRKKIQFTELDRKITFSAGLFLFTTKIMNIINPYFTEAKHFLQDHHFLNT